MPKIWNRSFHLRTIRLWQGESYLRSATKSPLRSWQNREYRTESLIIRLPWNSSGTVWLLMNKQSGARKRRLRMTHQECSIYSSMLIQQMVCALYLNLPLEISHSLLNAWPGSYWAWSGWEKIRLGLRPSIFSTHTATNLMLLKLERQWSQSHQIIAHLCSGSLWASTSISWLCRSQIRRIIMSEVESFSKTLLRIICNVGKILTSPPTFWCQYTFKLCTLLAMRSAFTGKMTVIQSCQNGIQTTHLSLMV